MWEYVQESGELLHNGDHVAFGYAGRESGKNNPQMQDVKGVGPLPCGMYTLGEPYDHPTVGRFAIPLEPDKQNQMFGRSSFFMHGDSTEHPGLASHGCIVQSFSTRTKVAASPEKQLRVAAHPEDLLR